LDGGVWWYWREVAMQGWRPVEDLVRWGFAHAPVVMANEAHNGLARCVRTREVGARMIRAAHEAGVRRLAMEALPHRPGDTQGPILAVPPDTEGYLAQPEMRRLIGTALDLGWTLWAYEAVIDITPDTDQNHLRSMEFTNWREREQAANLCHLVDAAPGEPLLVWCGNGHATKEKSRDWVPMGWHFREMSGVDPFVIDQTVTVDFGEDGQRWVRELLASLSDVLAAHGGTAGILRDQVPPPLDDWAGVDAFIVSTDNEMTEDGA
jgi:hypothetical protein